MLHQVVQHLRSGRYDFEAQAPAGTPGRQHVVTQGHAVGAAIAQVEAATFDDVDGLVLMSWTDARRHRAGDPTAAGADRRLRAGQATTRRSPPVGAGLPHAAVRERAARRAAGPPPASSGPGPLRRRLTSPAPLARSPPSAPAQVEAPVLLLYGGKDALTPARRPAHQAASYAATVAVTRTLRAAPAARCPLEKSAAKTRAAWCAGSR